MVPQDEALFRERDRLREELGRAQARIDALAGQLREYEKERAEIKARVERMLNRVTALDLRYPPWNQRSK